MEKKFKFSDNPTVAKSIYGAVIALLCISAIIVGIVAANNRKKDDIIENPPISDDGNTNPDDTNNENNGNSDNKQETLSFISPVVGSVIKGHSASEPVYSNTMEEWRIHTGMDISTKEECEVYAAEAGEVTKVYADPMYGNTVVITHSDEIKTVYSNLSKDNLPTVGQTVKKGEKIGTVGDSSIIEIADEVHLHFELLVKDTSVNPLDYISEESKEASLGMSNTEES